MSTYLWRVEIVRTPRLIPWLYPKRLWRLPEKDKVMYLTFDDGPTPGITEFVLDTLAEFDAQATFFCIGKNVREHPDLARRLRAEGHSVGNHTENHFNGWKVPRAAYLADVSAGQKSLEAVLGQGSGLFRPPYGKAGWRNVQTLRRSYQIVMWDVLAGDFYANKSKETVTQDILEKARPGSLVVLHDSVKCSDNVQHALPRVLQHFQEQGYTFEAIPDPASKIQI